MVDYIGLGYATLVTIGGLVGYFKAGSVVSFAAGVGAGFIAAFAALNHNFYILAGAQAFLRFWLQAARSF